MRWNKALAWEWHRWFAWHPIATPEQTGVWLEYVHRRRRSSFMDDSWEYRCINKREPREGGT